MKLGPNPPEPLSVHLGNCEFSDYVPRECMQGSRNVAIACIEPNVVESSDDLPLLTFAPVSCRNNCKFLTEI